ncbi:MAG: 2,3-bisphosphoglycerate-independent phosphoglycerate mutase [Tissierellia bacterium]|nr:2,3-bisphosphoglycerate-independent phosphoglycerate mutase [Tissierellia bacterium]
MKKTYMLMVLDGFGCGKDYPGNAISLANTPNIDRLTREYPNTTISASGLDVGLPEGQMGNSEVGHLNLGAGRIIYQELTRIAKEIESGRFFENKVFLNAIEAVVNNNSKLHLVGLLSDGGVHSHIDHLYALLKLAKQKGVKNVFVHIILDGRDVQPRSALTYLSELEKFMHDLEIGEIATVSGRYYAMDRDKRWERTKLAYDALVLGLGESGKNPKEIILKSYDGGIDDEFVVPTVIVDDNDKALGTMDTGDSIVFFNFRPDRARQITSAITDSTFDGFERKKVISTKYVTMTDYDRTFSNVLVAYNNEIPFNTLGQWLSDNGKTQLRTAETEKYPHVTFFFNGGFEEPFLGEDRIMVPSPKVATYDLKPEMSAQEVTDGLLRAISNHVYDVIIINFANCDMVGHSGIIEAAIKAVETVDYCLGQVVTCIEREGGAMIVTADHGNVEEMVDENGNRITAHTTNRVPLWIVDKKDCKLKDGGKLSDVAPTLLAMMGMKKPKEMTGTSLIEEE